MNAKRFLLLPTLLLSVVLGGCAGTKVGDFVSAVTTTITNPVRSVDIYRVKNVYAASLALAAQYRSYCWSKPYAALMAEPISKAACQNRRAIVLALQDADTKAFAAITSAENFVKNNPTLSATSAINAAWAAVQDFQAIAKGAVAKAGG